MPALVICGRRWYIGSDDFVIPAFSDLLFRLAWLIAVAVVYLKSDADLSSEGERGFYIKMFLYGVFGLLHLVIFFDIALIHNSKAGSVLDKNARKYVPLCLYFRLFFQTMEIVWTIVGTIGIFNGMLVRSSATEVGCLIIALVVSNWMLVLVGLVLLYLSFDPFGRYQHTLIDNGEAPPELVKEWERKCSVFSCFFSGSKMTKKEAFHGVAYLFAAMFEDVDVVPTDLVAGFILLALKNESINREKRKSLKLACKEKAAAILEKPKQIQRIEWPTTEQWNSIPVIFQIKKYAIATYNWPLIITGHSKPIRSLWKNSFCCGCMRKYPVEVVGDNCCFMKTSGLRTMVKIENADIIYVTFKNDMFHNPFFVAVDHPTKSIVVAIRGTLSIDDLIVDGNGRPFPVDIPGLPESFKAHHGIIRCARVLKEKLESLKLLPKAFASYPDYNLVLTGQSLGAGTATVLGMMLRADYPNLKCYAYAPPGGLLSADAAKYCESFVISLIYGDDLVGRMGIYSIEMLKYQIMGELNKCRTPKYRILLGDLYWLCGGFPKMRYDEKSGVIKHENGIASKESKSTVISVEDDGGKAKDVDDTVTKRTASKYSQYTVPEIKKLQPFEDMYPPGNILHITETETFKSAKKSGSRGAPRWSIRFADKSEFREFKVTSRMLFDHLPFRMYKALQDFSRRMINDCDISRHPPLVIDNIFKKKCKS